jgi:chlorophyll synthase
MTIDISKVPSRLSIAALVELLKPITWFPPMWAFGCGVISIGVPSPGQWPLVIAGVLLSGPLVCGASQIMNDWCDREVDAINEPQRPIPSGRAPGRTAFYFAFVWSGLALAVAAGLGHVAFAATLVGLAFAWAYSSPPPRLKANGWYGAAAVAICYEGLPWITGAAIMAGGPPGGAVLMIALLYSVGAHGIMTLNDFKAIEGDRRMGIASLPVQLGPERAAKVACLVMAAAQAAVVLLMAQWGRPAHAAIIAASLAAQLVLMKQLMKDPRGKAPWYNATGVSLYVLGMMVAAQGLQGLDGASP